MTDSNIVLARQFDAVKPASLANLSVYRNIPTANLVPTFKVGGYEIQPVFIGSEKITVAVLSFSKKATKTQPEVYNEVNELVDLTLDVSQPTRKVWISDYSDFSQATVSKIVQATQKLLTKLPVGILVARGIIDQSQAETVLSDAVLISFNLPEDMYYLAEQFAEYYFAFAAKYPAYAVVKPNDIGKHLQHDQLKQIAASTDPNSAF